LQNDSAMSVRLANASEVDTDRYEYDAYGNHWSVSGSTPNNMLYKGEEYDSNLGLYYLRARYYNPLTGRFTGRAARSKPNEAGGPPVRGDRRCENERKTGHPPVRSGNRANGREMRRSSCLICTHF